MRFRKREMIKILGGGGLICGASQPISAQSEETQPVIFAVTDTGSDIAFGSEPDDYNAQLLAIDAESGDVIWTFDEPEGDIWSHPTVVDGTVYFGSQDDNLYAVDAESGDEVWVRSPGNMNTSPTIVDDHVYVGTWDGVWALDGGSGDVRWIFDGSETHLGEGLFHESETRFRHSSPQVVNDILYIGGDDSTLYAIDAKIPNQSMGEVLWSTNITNEAAGNSSLVGTPTVYDGFVYVGASDGYLHAVNASTGEKEWQKGIISRASSQRHGPPVVYDDTIYVVSGRRGDGFNALDPKTGEIKWSISEDEFTGRIAGGQTGGTRYAPVIVDDIAYVSLPSYAIKGIDLNSEEVVWSTPIPGEGIENSAFPVPQTQPTVLNGVIYCGGREYDTGFTGWYAVDIESRDLRWKVNDGPVGASPTGVKDTISGHSSDVRVNLGIHGHHHTSAEDPNSPRPPEFRIIGVEYDNIAEESETVEVHVEMKNVGDFTDQNLVQITREPGEDEHERIATKEVSIEPDQTKSIIFEDILIQEELKEYVSVRLGDSYELEAKVSDLTGSVDDEYSADTPSDETDDATQSEDVPGFGFGAAAVALGGFLKLSSWLSSSKTGNEN